MRRLLAVLIVGTLGAVAHAQYLTPAGGAVVTALEGLPVQSYASAAAEAAKTTPGRIEEWAPVIFSHGGVAYSGYLDVADVTAAIQAVLTYFYNTTCLTCPVWGETGTGLDAYVAWSPADWAFVAEERPDQTSPPTTYQHYCQDASSSRWEFAVTTWEQWDSVNQTWRRYYRSWHRSSPSGWSAYQANAVSPASAINTMYTSVPNGINARCKAPTLVGWEGGNYWELDAPPEPHPDTFTGLKIAWVAVQAKLARETAPFQLIVGLEWDPSPSAEALGIDPDAPPGGGGGDVIVEPGTCEDGWVLTRKVCEIWQFISHDAWVPQTPLSQRWQALQANAESRLPFAMGSWFHFYVENASEAEWWGDTTYSACPVVPIRLNLPGVVDTTADLDFCGNAIADFVHERLRTILYIVGLVVMSFVAFRWVTGA